MSLTLIIGTKRWSSWSLRPWIAMKEAKLSVQGDHTFICANPIRARILGIFPGRQGADPDRWAGRMVWESLAILDYLAVRFPDAKLWPQDMSPPRPMRGRFRRNACRLPGAAQALHHEPVAAAEAAAAARRRCWPTSRRIEAMWADCRARFGVAAGRFCSAPSARPTPCMRRWSRACTPTASRFVEHARLHGRGDGSAGVAAMVWRGDERDLDHAHNEPDWPWCAASRSRVGSPDAPMGLGARRQVPKSRREGRASATPGLSRFCIASWVATARMVTGAGNVAARCRRAEGARMQVRRTACAFAARAASFGARLPCGVIVP